MEAGVHIYYLHHQEGVHDDDVPSVHVDVMMYLDFKGSLDRWMSQNISVLFFLTTCWTPMMLSVVKKNQANACNTSTFYFKEKTLKILIKSKSIFYYLM